jgi:hypothetical protein
LGWSENLQFRNALIWAAVGGFALLGVVLPLLFMDGMSGGFGIACLSGFVAMCCGIGAAVFLFRGFALDKILRGEELVVHWTYSPEEWRRYSEAEYGRDRQLKFVLFCIIAGFALFFGVLFLIFGGDGGRVVFFVMLGLIVLIGGVAALSIFLAHRSNETRLGEARISRIGVYLNRDLHNWNMVGARLDDVSLVREESLLVAFTYSYPSRTGRQSTTVRVPVPAGREGEAERVVAYFTQGTPFA